MSCFCQDTIPFAVQQFIFQPCFYTSAASFRRKSQPLHSTPPLLLFAVLLELGCTAIQFHANVKPYTLTKPLIALWHLGEPNRSAHISRQQAHRKILHWECDSQKRTFPLSAVQSQRVGTDSSFKQPKFLKQCTKNTAKVYTIKVSERDVSSQSFQLVVSSGTQTCAI